MVKNYDNFFLDDKLNIRSDVVSFAHLIEQEKYQESIKSSKVYAISAEFGIGKTFFCERLFDVLSADKVPTTKINIWEMDFYDNPLIPILAEIQHIYISEKNHKDDFPTPSQLPNLFKSILSGVSVKAKIPHIGEIEINCEKIANQHEKLKKQSTDKNVDIYTEYQQYKTELETLKTFLKKWAKAESEKGNPIVIIIDELDRCRPDYAVKTLEVLKHFFDMPGFIFVLALDEAQLQSSVKCLFGTENFDGYKRKFINNSFLLRTPDKIKFAEYLYTKTGLDDVIEDIQDANRDLIFRIKKNGYRINSQEEQVAASEFNKWQISESVIKRFFAAYSIWFKFSLRQMEQVFDRLVLFIKEVYVSGEIFSPDLAVLLVCLHEFDINIYNKLREHNSNIQNVLFQIHGNTTSFSNAVHEDRKEIAKRFGKINRNIVPQMPAIETYSKNGNSQLLHDNVDRFFNLETNHNGTPAYIVEAQDLNNRFHNNIDTRGVIAYIVNEDRYNNETKTHDTATGFDLAKFKQSYFDKMDFISRFSNKPIEDPEPKHKTEATQIFHSWLESLHPATNNKVQKIAKFAANDTHNNAEIIHKNGIKIYEQPINKSKCIYYIQVDDKFIFLFGGDKLAREENIKQSQELAQEYKSK